MCEAFHKTRHEASGVDARDVRGGKRIRVQGAQAVFRQAILRVKTRRSRTRLLAASPVSQCAVEAQLRRAGAEGTAKPPARARAVPRLGEVRRVQVRWISGS